MISRRKFLGLLIGAAVAPKAVVSALSTPKAIPVVKSAWDPNGDDIYPPWRANVVYGGAGTPDMFITTTKLRDEYTKLINEKLKEAQMSLRNEMLRTLWH